MCQPLSVAVGDEPFKKLGLDDLRMAERIPTDSGHMHMGIMELELAGDES